MSKDHVLIRELNTKICIRQSLDNNTLNFNQIFFRQIKNLP